MNAKCRVKLEHSRKRMQTFVDRSASATGKLSRCRITSRLKPGTYVRALRLPGANDVPHLVKDDPFEGSLRLHAGDVIDVEGHLSRVRDAATV